MPKILLRDVFKNNNYKTEDETSEKKSDTQKLSQYQLTLNWVIYKFEYDLTKFSHGLNQCF